MCSHLSDGNGKKMGNFGEPIHHYQYAILTLGLVKTSDEIHGDIFPLLLRNGLRSQQAFHLGVLNLVLLILLALIGMLKYIMLQSLPCESLPKFLICLNEPWMSH